VKSNGDIQPCQALYDEAFCLGNIHTFDGAELARRMERIHTLAQKRLLQDYRCDRCILRGGCGKGCMAMAFDLSGDCLGDDGDCECRKLEFVNQKLSGLRTGAHL
jgi:radical SAM protein with 4Fe4S-binding SPASM domain